MTHPKLAPEPDQADNDAETMQQPFPYSVGELFERTADDVFAALLRQSTGGVNVRTNAAPAVSTQFVKSRAKSRAGPGVEGAFAEIIYPSDKEVTQRLSQKHANANLFGYTSCRRSDAFPIGYGERSARALAREETTYQLKGIFPSALVAYSKLRAKVEAREGDTEAVDTIFSIMWGLPLESIQMLPQLKITGSEPTRVAALEDRAYHALSAHPSISGGYRVDTATLAPDALGPSVPLNWPRLRTALKAIANVQIQGDLQLATTIARLNEVAEFRFRMDMTRGSQPMYMRPANWETLIQRILLAESTDEQLRTIRERDTGYAVFSELANVTDYKIHPEIEVLKNVKAIANTVSAASSKALERTVKVLLAYDNARIELMNLEAEEVEDMSKAELSDIVEIPRYKVMRQSLYRGLTREYKDLDTLPDMRSHGKPHAIINLRELRESNLTIPVDVIGAFHMAVYMNTMRPNVQIHAYELMERLNKLHPRTSGGQRAAQRLRKQELYETDTIRCLGPKLFGMEFNNVFEMLLRNMSTATAKSDLDIKLELWEYLCRRSHSTKRASVAGGWRDLLEYLWTAPEGWTMYYWVRMTIGNTHHATSDGILAPIAAGSEADALTVVKLGVKDRIQRWVQIYTSRYKIIEDGLAEKRRRDKEKEAEEAEKRERKTEERRSGRVAYVPPHLRRMEDLGAQYDADEILARTQQFEKTEYERMVEYQTKAKFFASIDVFTNDRRIVIGVADDKMRDMLIEFYQARWYSLEVRINKANSHGRVFHLGGIPFPTHPWGEVATVFPESVSGMIDFMSALNPDAWTLPPDYIYTKLKKSISELWADVQSEVSTLRTYVAHVHDGLLDQQEEADAGSRSTSVLYAMGSADAIPLPTKGYRAPHQMSSHRYSFQDADKDVSITAEQQLPPDTPEENAEDEEALFGDDDDGLGECEGFDPFEMPTKVEETAQVLEYQYVSLRTIWHILDLPEKSDKIIRFGFGVGAEIDLDAPHIDGTIGPIALIGEESKIQGAWKYRLSNIQKRIALPASQVIIDDM